MSKRNHLDLNCVNLHGCFNFTVKLSKKFDFDWFCLSINYTILSLFYSIVLNIKNFRIFYIYWMDFLRNTVFDK